MGLSIRHPKGKLSRRWYWDCQINDRSVSVGLCKMQGRPPREWSLAVPDWSVAHAGDRAFEESRARAVEMAPAAIARKRELLNKAPRAIMEQALKQAQGSKRRKIPTIRTLHADYAEDTECLRAPEGESQLRRKVVTVEKMRKHLKCVFDRMLPEGSANPFLLDPIPKDEEEDTHPAVALPPPSSGEMTLAEIVKQLSKEDKAKLKALPPEEKADILKLRTLDDFETFLALR